MFDIIIGIAAPPVLAVGGTLLLTNPCKTSDRLWGLTSIGLSFIISIMNYCTSWYNF